MLIFEDVINHIIDYVNSYYCGYKVRVLSEVSKWPVCLYWWSSRLL